MSDIVYKIWDTKNERHIAVSSTSRISQTVWSDVGKAKRAALKYALETPEYMREYEKALAEAKATREYTFHLRDDVEKEVRKKLGLDKYANQSRFVVECYTLSFAGNAE